MGGAIGATILQAVTALIPQGLLPSSMPLSLDARVLAFCALTAIGVAIAFGLVPAWQATGAALKPGGRTATIRSSGVRQLLVAGEVAVAVLLCGARLLLRTWLALGEVDPGHRTRNLLTMIVSPGMSSDPAAMRRFYDTAEREVRSVPGVLNVAWGSSLPLAGLWYGQSFQIEGDPPPARPGVRSSDGPWGDRRRRYPCCGGRGCTRDRSGAALGLAAAAALGQLIASLLFGVEALDAVTYLGVVLVIGVTGLVATAATALRATRVDPAVAFRSE